MRSFKGIQPETKKPQHTDKMKILHTITGYITTARGIESVTKHITRSRRLTERGAMRIIRAENPGTQFVLGHIQFAEFGR